MEDDLNIHVSETVGAIGDASKEKELVKKLKEKLLEIRDKYKEE